MANEWLRYANQGATRSQPISPELVQALGGILPKMGVTMDVFSGGQAAKGSGGPRTGSVRHDHGGAADVFFHKDGRRLDWANQQDLPLFQDIVRQAKAAGVTGFGAGPGYMQPGSMHIGFGKPGVWGAGGSSRNAPSWLAEAYGGAPAGPAPVAMASAEPTPAPAAPAGVASMFSNPLAGQAMAMMPGGAPGGAPAGPGATAEPAGMLLGNLASVFLQNQQSRQQQRQDEQEAEQIRRAALLGGGGVAGLYG